METRARDMEWREGRGRGVAGWALNLIGLQRGNGGKEERKGRLGWFDLNSNLNFEKFKTCQNAGWEWLRGG
jgi:hypothetical protein